MPVVPPPLAALAFGFVQHRLAPEARSGPLRRVAAAAVGVGSVGLLAATSRRFSQAHTQFEPFDPSKTTALVTEGPNAFTRNPMYVGMAGVLAAHALARGGWLTPLPVLGFLALMDRIQVRPEEAALRNLFGAEYDAYCQRVPRWIGPAPS